MKIENDLNSCGCLFAIIHQLGVFGPKAQYLVISFILGEIEALPEFHFRDLLRHETNFIC